MAVKTVTYNVEKGITCISVAGKVYKVSRGKIKFPVGAPFIDDLLASGQIFPEKVEVQQAALKLAEKSEN